MEIEEAGQLIQAQRNFLATNKTLDIKFRLEVLKKIRSLIIENESEIVNALWKDFHKPELEVIATETGFVLKELNHIIRNLRRWAGKRRVYTPMVHFISWSYVIPQPYGQVLILSPWNFPFQLAFLPMIGAIAAGNCVIIKASGQVPYTTGIMKKIMDNLPSELVTLITGDHVLSDYLLDQKFDYIFFTGSPEVGKHVMRKAAENLIPVSLELGGKNPCVVASDAKLEFAVRRILWGKLINCGQTCIGPDYVLIDRKIQDQFLELIVKEIRDFYKGDPGKSDDFARVISGKKVSRLADLVKSANVVTGGNYDEESKYMSPTILRDVTTEDAIMKEEIFGPVLPVLAFDDFEEVYSIISRNPKPLGTYIFSTNKKLIGRFLVRTQSGNVAVNETVMQIASPFLPYGGVGTSGIGRYHGRKSFETFSNMRSVLVKSNLLDLKLRYPPYNRLKLKMVSFFMRL